MNYAPYWNANYINQVLFAFFIIKHFWISNINPLSSRELALRGIDFKSYPFKTFHIPPNKSEFNKGEFILLIISIWAYMLHVKKVYKTLLIKFQKWRMKNQLSKPQGVHLFVVFYRGKKIKLKSYWINIHFSSSMFEKCQLLCTDPSRKWNELNLCFHCCCFTSNACFLCASWKDTVWL